MGMLRANAILKRSNSVDHISTTPLPAYNGYSSPGIIRLMKILSERKSYL